MAADLTPEILEQLEADAAFWESFVRNRGKGALFAPGGQLSGFYRHFQLLAGALQALVAAAKERDQLRVELESLKQQQEVHLARIDQLSQTTSLQEELEKWESQRGKMMAEVGTLRAENKRLEHRLQHDRENDGLLEIIDQRDAFHERIDEIADVLGDETEWSNCNDRGVRALELAAEVIADRNQMRDEVANLSEQLTESQLARIALSEELDQLRGEIYKERAIQKVETP